MLTRADLMNVEESLDELLLLAKVELRRVGGPPGVLGDIIENGGWALARVRGELGLVGPELSLQRKKEARTRRT